MPSQNSQNSDAELMLGLLRAVETDESLTQRSAARDMGIALGLVNTYFKRCVKKGYVKVKHAPANRYAYHLTPKGFAEKSRLTAEFLYQSLSLFRQAQDDYEALFKAAIARGWSRVGLLGASDLADMVILLAKSHPIEIVGIASNTVSSKVRSDIVVRADMNEFDRVDGWFFTELENPQERLNNLMTRINPNQILVPTVLEVVMPDQDKSKAKAKSK